MSSTIARRSRGFPCPRWLHHHDPLASSSRRPSRPISHAPSARSTTNKGLFSWSSLDVYGRQRNRRSTSTRSFPIPTAWPTTSGYAVTNHHVVAGKPSIVLINSEGEEIAARVVSSDELNDIALLSVEDPARLPAALPLACSSARLGSSVFTIGFPRVDVMGTTPKLSLGIISGVNGLYDDPASYQISVSVQPGNSGGPLLNMQGEVVGIITSMLGTMESADGKTRPIANINYALKADRIEKLLLDVPRQAGEAGLTVVKSGRDSLEALAGRIQNSVMIVRAGTSLSPQRH